MDRDTTTPTVDGVPGERASALVDRHHEVAAPSTHVYPFVWDVDRAAAGPFVTDADGNVLMDWTTHVGAAPLGYDNSLITEKLAAYDLGDPEKFAGQDFYAVHGDTSLPGPTELMERLTDHSSHYGLDSVFLSNTGAEAVENAIKVAYDHTGGQFAVTFDGAFHGRTLGALSLNRSKGVHRREFPTVGGVHDVPFCTDRSCSPSSCDCGYFAGDQSALERGFDAVTGSIPADDTAYVILEPIQGEGGLRVPSDAFLSDVAAVADDHDVPLVVDEVQAGIGRTGEFWASDHYDVDPDLIASAKGLRVGATIGAEETMPEENGRLSSTWGAGDLLSCAVGAFTIDAIDEADLLENATRMGERFRERLRDRLAADDPVTDVRGKGLMLAVEYDGRERRGDVLEAAFSAGLLTLPAGKKTLRLLPPLDSTPREIDLGVDLVVEATRRVS